MQQYTRNLSDKVSKPDMLNLESFSKANIEPRLDVDETSPSIIKKHKKKNKNRCSHDGCNKKLTLVDKTMGECKCNNLYCHLHRDISKHVCSYDWHSNKKAELAAQLNSNKCVASKLTSI